MPKLRHKSAMRKMVQGVESGLMEWTLTRLTPELMDEAMILELLGAPEDREMIASALVDTSFGRNVAQVCREMRDVGVDEREILLAIFKTGFALGMRTVDLAVVRGKA